MATFVRHTILVMILFTLVASLAIQHSYSLLTKVLVANGPGQFQQRPRGTVDGRMYFCGVDSSNYNLEIPSHQQPLTYRDTWSSNNVRDCLYGDDGSTDGSVPAAIDIIYPFFLDEIGFLYGLNAKMKVTGEAHLTSDLNLGGARLRFYIFNFSAASWVELGAGISQHPHTADDYTDTAMGGFTDSFISVTFTENLPYFADGNGNMKLRWSVVDTTNGRNHCLFARIDFMEISFTAKSIPVGPIS